MPGAVLERSAYFDPIIIRRGALKLGLSSDSSYRFERGIDITGVVKASDRASELICKTAKAKLGDIIDISTKKRQPVSISLRPARVNEILGASIKTEEIRTILQSLGFTVASGKAMEVAVPSFRDDVRREADLIEEIARIYGYEKISDQPPNIIATDEAPSYKDFIRKRGIAKKILSSFGFQEVLTYSLISGDMLKRIDMPEGAVIPIRNPLSREQEIMRPTILPGILKTVSHNISRQIQTVDIFELSNIYFQKDAEYIEEESLAIASYGRICRNPSETYADTGLSKIKGAITNTGARMGISRLGFEQTHHPMFVAGQTLAVLSGDTMLGTIGKVKQHIAEAFDIKTYIYAAEFNFAKMVESSNINRFYSPVPRFPYSYRDISFAADIGVTYKEIEDSIRATGTSLVDKIELLSEYRGRQIPEGQRALAVRVIYQSRDRTLTEEEVNRLDQSIRAELTRNFKVTLR